MKTYQLQLPANLVNVVLAGLKELPWKHAHTVIAVIEQQVVAQDNAPKSALPPIPR